MSTRTYVRTLQGSEADRNESGFYSQTDFGVIGLEDPSFTIRAFV